MTSLATYYRSELLPMTEDRKLAILSAVEGDCRVPADVTPTELEQLSDCIEQDGDEASLTTLGEMELDGRETDRDDADLLNTDSTGQCFTDADPGL